MILNKEAVYYLCNMPEEFFVGFESRDELGVFANVEVDESLG